jgi:AcrR family transcriptional regulator
MPRVTTTRERILATALQLFLAEGYDSTSLRDIAVRLEISKAAVYYHFPAKEQIVTELTRAFLDELADLVSAARSARVLDQAQFRMEVLAAYLDLLVDHQQIVDLLSRDPAAQNHPDVGKRARNLVRSLTAELSGEDASAEDKVRIACAIGVIHAVGITSVAMAEPSREVILGAALAVLHAPPLKREAPDELSARRASLDPNGRSISRRSAD